MRRKLLIVIASVGALLVAALLFVRAWIVRDDTSPVSVDKVVQDYRGSTTAASTTPEAQPPAGVKIPAAGVYQYTTTGGEQTTILGTSRHDYPAVTTIAIRPTDCGYEQTWTALDKRSETWSLCKAEDALKPQTLRDVHSFYSHDDDRVYDCTDDGVFPLKRGDGTQTIACSTSGDDPTDMTEVVRVIGTESVEVDGTSVDTIHLRIAQTLKGSTDGTGTVDWWLDRKTGLPIRVAVDNASKSDTPIGKRAPYTEQFTLKLRSLTPQS